MMIEVIGTRDDIQNVTHVAVRLQDDGRGSMEFWKSFPSFSPRGYQSFHTLFSEQEIRQKVKDWEAGNGLSFS